MTTFVAVCIGIMALTQVVTLVIWAMIAVHLRRAAQAVEVTAYRASDQVERLGQATEKAKNFASALNTGWLRTAALAAGAAAFWSRRSQKEAHHV